MSVENLKIEDVESLINQDLSKNQLITLGTKRLGITKSKLVQLNKCDAIETIKAAINHELSLNIISKEAKRAGENRRS